MLDPVRRDLQKHSEQAATGMAAHGQTGVKLLLIDGILALLQVFWTRSTTLHP
jgi:hypothetical protein